MNVIVKRKGRLAIRLDKQSPPGIRKKERDAAISLLSLIAELFLNPIDTAVSLLPVLIVSLLFPVSSRIMNITMPS
ncbi:hypothetical protein [Lachnoclostridium sp. Marseille-P6806]|uniref:hypothetical protein n=1 Tax=Lachnoclostridium sp. Marseille-P6806 TaxID=2364793 RepID=UPI003FA5E318